MGKTFRACRPMDSLFRDQIEEVLHLGYLKLFYLVCGEM